MNPRITIAVYKPLDGKQAALHQLVLSHPEVLAMWSEFGAVCTFLPTNAVPEINNMFSEFTPLD